MYGQSPSRKHRHFLRVLCASSVSSVVNFNTENTESGVHSHKFFTHPAKNTMLKVLEFINRHPNDWRDLLAQPPYCISVRDDGCYTILSYSQFNSDFNEEVVRECRGLIIRNDTYQPVCIPFFKFGNYGESYCPPIDWQSARVQEKLDGSLIKVWHDAGWRVSTNGVIDARCAQVNNRDSSFRNLFEEAWNKTGADYQALNPEWTYLFELCLPKNRVVVLHEETKLCHIGTRNNKTLEELDRDIGIPKPKIYSFRSFEDCVEAAKALPFNEEGYVIVDKYWNRVKIKSPAYVRVALMVNNGWVTTTRIIEMIRAGETAEFLTYFPDYQPDIDRVSGAIVRLSETLSCSVAELERMNFETQKDFALHVKGKEFAAYYFEWRKNGTSPQTWLHRLPADRLARYLEASTKAIGRKPAGF